MSFVNESALIGQGRLRPRVMVVDDDPVIGCALAGALNRGGCDVEVFRSSTEALDAFDQLEIDLAVVDWIMPDLDGLSLADGLKAKAPGLPTLLITGYGDHEEIRNARTDGRFAAVLDKPFDLRYFVSTVQSCLHDGSAVAAEVLETAQAGTVIPGPGSRAPAGGRMSGGRRKAFHEQMLADIVDAIIVVDRRGRVIYHNRAAGRMFGFESRPDESLAFADFCPFDSRVPDALTGYFDRHAPVPGQSEAFFQRLDGERFYAVYSVSPFADEQREAAVILVIKNIDDCYQTFQSASQTTRDMETLAITDPLTGTYNRRHFDRRLDEELKRVERYNSPLTLMMIDFDHFKQVNDVFGHLVGDKVLIKAARILSKGLRDVDTFARWGGEEFMILLPEAGSETASRVACRLHSLISGSKEWEAIAPGLKITISMGLVNLPWDRHERLSAAKVLSALDRALYKAKNWGRNQVVRYLNGRDSFERCDTPHNG